MANSCTHETKGQGRSRASFWMVGLEQAKRGAALSLAAARRARFHAPLSDWYGGVALIHKGSEGFVFHLHSPSLYPAHAFLLALSLCSMALSYISGHTKQRGKWFICWTKRFSSLLNCFKGTKVSHQETPEEQDNGIEAAREERDCSQCGRVGSVEGINFFRRCGDGAFKTDGKSWTAGLQPVRLVVSSWKLIWIRIVALVSEFERVLRDIFRFPFCSWVFAPWGGWMSA